jgi:hypothetical protein
MKINGDYATITILKLSINIGDGFACLFGSVICGYYG